MTKQRAEPTDPGGYFSEENPTVQQESVEWSNAMHGDPTVENVFSVMNEGRQYLTDGPFGSLEPHSARLAASQIVRGAVVRVIAHRFAMNMAPLAAGLLEGDDFIVRAALQDPVVDVVKPSRTGIRTDFARVWFGDDARLLLVTGLLLQSVTHRTIDQLPSGIRAATLRAGIWVTQAANDVIAYRELQEKQSAEPVNKSWSEGPRQHFVIRHESERGNWHERFLLDCLARGVKMDACSFLIHNTEASTEHITAYLTDAFHGFIPYGDMATSNDKLRSVIARLHMSSALAFMANWQNSEAEYNNRYVESASVGPGRYVSAREPLVRVSPNGQNYDLVPNLASAYAKATRGKRNRCPGPDALEPLGAEIDASGRLRRAMKLIVHDYDEQALRALDRPYSEIDVITALGAAVGRVLIDVGFAAFDQADIAHQLRPRHKATSTGAYIFAQ